MGNETVQIISIVKTVYRVVWNVGLGSGYFNHQEFEDLDDALEFMDEQIDNVRQLRESEEILHNQD